MFAQAGDESQANPLGGWPALAQLACVERADRLRTQLAARVVDAHLTRVAGKGDLATVAVLDGIAQQVADRHRCKSRRGADRAGLARAQDQRELAALAQMLVIGDQCRQQAAYLGALGLLG